MNDYIDYMNALSASVSTNEQAQNAYQSMINYKDQLVQAKDDYKQQFAIIPELITGASGEYILKGLGTKAISLLTDTAKSAVSNAIKTGLKNAGIDEETAEATANDILAGNVSNIADRITASARGIVGEAGDTLGETANTLRNIGASVIDQVQQGGDIGSALESATAQARSAVSGAVEDIANQGLSVGTDALNIGRSVVQEGASAVGGLAEQGLGVAEGAISSAQGAITGIAQQAQGALETAGALAEQGVGVAQGAISGAQSVAGDIVAQGSSMATNFYANNISNTSFPTLGQVQERTGFPLEEWSDDWGSASRLQEQSWPSLTRSAPTAPQDVEMVDMASIEPSTTAEVAPTADIATTATAEAGTTVGADVGADVATDVGVTAGLEALGGTLDATGLLAPIGAIVGLIGGLAGFFGLEKREPLPPPPPPPPVLNPSQSFGT